MTTIRFRHLAVVALGAVVLPLGLVACGNDSSDTAASSTTATTAKDSSTKQAPPKVTDVWARPGKVGDTSAIYMSITTGDEEDHLTKAALPAGYSKSVELHETSMAGSDSSTTMPMGSSTTMGGMDSGSETTTSMADGMMGMKQVDEITIAPNSTLQLKPGGYHIMVIDLEKDLKVGDEVPVTLTFEHSGTVDVTATVREP
ncbi:MAG: copper chaperone PCu(A)C [Microthrixaceae bacterium]